MEETQKTIELSNRFYQLLVITLVVLGIFLAGVLLQQFMNLPQNYPQQTSVSGQGKAFAKPDVATVNLGVATRAEKSQDAVREGNSKMNEVIKAVKDSGIEEKDIKTTFYNLFPVYGRKEVPLPYPEYYPQPGNEITGYSLNQQVQVKIRNFDNISAVLDKATSLGANTVGELQFTVDDMEKAKSEARLQAIENAKQKAMDLTKTSGLRLGKLINVYEDYGYPQPLYRGDQAILKDSVSVSPQIEPGQTEVTSNVTLVYWVK